MKKLPETTQMKETKILIIDDDPMIGLQISSILKNHGMNAETANSAEQGVSLAKSCQPALILLDIVLPDIDGLEVCKELKNDGKTCDIPVIFLSGLKDTQNLVKGFENGGVDYISKPFKKDELLARLKLHLAIKDSKEKIENEFKEHKITSDKKLREAKEKAEFINRNVHSAIYTIDENLSIITWNYMAAEITGFGEEEVIGKSIEKILGNQYSKKNNQLCPLHKQEYRIITKTGKSKVIVHSLGKFEDKNHNFIEWIGSFDDITLRKEVENELKINEAKLRNIFVSAPNAFAIANIEGIIIDCNQTCLELFKYNYDELIGTHSKNLFAKENRKKISELLVKLPVQVNIRNLEIECKRKNEKHFIGEVSLGQIFDKQGNPENTIFVVTDITEKIRTKKSLQENEFRFKTLFRDAPDAYYLISEKGEFIDGNKAAEDLLGYRKDELIGKTFYKTNILPINQIPKSIFNLKINANGKKVGPIEFTLRRKDGNLVFVEIVALPITLSDKKVVLGIARDISIRKETEKAIQLREENFSNIFNNSNDGIIITDYRDQFIEINAAFCNLTGYSKTKLFKIGLQGLLKKETIAKRRKIVIEIKKTNDLIYQSEIISKSGEVFYAEIRSRVIPFNGKNTILSIVRDITLRKKELVELQQASDFIKNIQTGLYIYQLEDLEDDTTLRMVSANPASEKLTGVKTSDVIGKTLDENFPKLRSKGIPQQYARVIREQKAIEIEDLTYSDDRVIEGAFSIHAFPLPNNQVGVSFENVTLKKIMDQELRNSEEKFRAMTENSPDIIIRFNKKCEQLYVNKRIKNLSGISPKKIIGRNLEDLGFSDEMCLLWRTEITKVFNTKEISSLNYTVFDANNQQIIFDWRLIPEFDEYGEVISVLSILRDVTSQKQAEEEIRAYNEEMLAQNEGLKLINDELIKAKEKAEESDRLKSAFLANMSHEIRTPMNGIIGFANLLDEEDLPADRRRKYIDVINSSTNQLLAIITDIVDISKIEAGQIDISIEKCNLHKLLTELHAQFEIEKKNKSKFDIEIILEETLTESQSNIETDDVRLKQVISNLVLNALKFTNKGYIKFGYTLTDTDTLNFFVADTGIGISKENQSLIFDRFRQEDDSHTRKFGGTGLGLSISQGLVELMGGKLWCESEKGKGSVFYFTHPYKPAFKVVPKPNQTPAQPVEQKNLQNKVVLLVEDILINQMFFREIFETYKLNYIIADTGYQAIELFEKNPNIDIVLMDIQLPDINGYEVTKKMKAIRPAIPIIAQTAYALAGDQERSLEAGCDDYISKPVDRKILMEKMNNLLKL